MTNEATPVFKSDLITHRPLLMAIAIKRLRNTPLAEDIVSCVMIKALGAWRSFSPGTNMKGWLCRILFNEIVNHFRKDARHKTVSLEQAADIPLHTLSADEMVRYREILDLIRTWPYDVAEIVDLVCLQGYQYDEAAQIMKISAGTIKSRLFRARARLNQLAEAL